MAFLRSDVRAIKNMLLSGASAAECFSESIEKGQVEIDFVVKPKDAKEVMAIIKWANNHMQKLVPISSKGGPRRHGLQGLKGKVSILDLSEMDKVIHADSRDAIAIIEPGVTFPQFDNHLQRYGLRSIKPLCPRPSKSVLSTYLEREPSIAFNDHWDSTDPLSSLNIIFGNGEQFRTGGASVPGSLEKNLAKGLRQMMSSGPVATDYTRVLLGSQGTLGVVCWGAIYCERIPTIEKVYVFGSNDLTALISLTQSISLRQIGTHSFIVNKVQLEALLIEPSAGMSEEHDSLPGAEQLPNWLIYVSLSTQDYEPQQAIEWQEIELLQLAVSANAITIDADANGHISERLRLRLQKSPDAYYKDAPLGCHTSTFCVSKLSAASTIVKQIELAVSDMLTITETKSLIGYYVQPMVQGVSCHVEVNILHTARMQKEMKTNSDRIIKVMAENGGFISRPYGQWSHQAFSIDAQIVPHLKQVKQMFDPGCVLSPGRLCY
jgi:FAD/FMN-containing dehydrogenase